MILRNVRIPTVLQGDLRGMIEACKTGSDRFIELSMKYGIELLRRQMQLLMDTSRHVCAKSFASFRTAPGRSPTTSTATRWATPRSRSRFISR
ncbi:MAG: hydantoinase B/oxoprolinase family protein [Actinomycetota bacterium]